jgi:hypothetical protein
MALVGWRSVDKALKSTWKMLVGSTNARDLLSRWIRFLVLVSRSAAELFGCSVALHSGYYDQ